MNQAKSDQLRRIKIKGFKSIRECDLEFRDINVLIGCNGAGKSNLISVFTMLRHVLSSELSFYVGQNGVISLFYSGIKKTECILAEFYFNRGSYSFELVPTQYNSVIFKEERFGYQGQWESSGLVSGGYKESVWEQGSGNKNIDHYFLPVLKTLQWRVYHFHDTGNNSKVKSEHNITNNKALLYDASNLAAFLLRLRSGYPLNYQKIIDAIQLIAPYFKDFELDPNEFNSEYVILRWRQRGCEDIFSASQLSDGTLRFICLATLLLQPDNLQPATIIIDEPELGLHPFAVTVFADLVKRAAAMKQIILSTQSVDLVNEFEADDIVVVDHVDNASTFSRLSAEELRVWLEDDYSLGELWCKNLLGGRPSI
jgi:predicted ATPase